MITLRARRGFDVISQSVVGPVYGSGIIECQTIARRSGGDENIFAGSRPQPEFDDGTDGRATPLLLQDDFVVELYFGLGEPRF
ncbi:MAG: hypothetical protein Q27BB25_10425 [Blastomonas sp. CACIA14H2]|nr:MAG: hypothetical protein Q27BB25_10425 [Blastomonas sp. CACIA14H2]